MNTQIGQTLFVHHQYSAQQRVTREVRDGGARSYTFDYTASGHSDAYDHWKIKTVETRPDGSEHIVYTNCIGQILIKELRAGSQRWIESRTYDADGRQIERARPSAVVHYDDAQRVGANPGGPGLGNAQEMTSPFVWRRRESRPLLVNAPGLSGGSLRFLLRRRGFSPDLPRIACGGFAAAGDAG